ncbi:MAG: hypothetical protein KC468_11230 [Myxococcales bacterium]|nr:hypothetical protein [Myxococcales bacterium]
MAAHASSRALLLTTACVLVFVLLDQINHRSVVVIPRDYDGALPWGVVRVSLAAGLSLTSVIAAGVARLSSGDVRLIRACTLGGAFAMTLCSLASLLRCRALWLQGTTPGLCVSCVFGQV